MSLDFSSADLATSEQFRAMMDVCADSYDKETAPEERRRLASAALLFAQVAEYLERGNSVTQEITARCTHAISLVREHHARRKIEVLLSGERNIKHHKASLKSAAHGAEQ